MAFITSPDGVSIEILQEGSLEIISPWKDMENIGSW
jgi:lactoylglutathione lyase